MIEECWVHTDEAEDVAGSVRHALRCYRMVTEDAQAWKWIALALHSALQGACICHLATTTGPIGAITKKNAAEWLKYLDERRRNEDAKVPKTHLLPLPDLIKAVRKPHSAGDRSNATGVQLTNQEVGWLRRFHQHVRNQFVHFEPMGWSLEVSGIPDLGKLIARIIDEIANMGWAFRHQDERWIAALRADLAALSRTTA